ncbi:uncharacterized protein LOC124286631 [Haliotis rubra]|uniref:uncharacterized protein LOC124286631 n=1 Tax=Haliotis rubra TaxID=36100 RepID=UPI001EE5E227|nr:uncharacterized protein LOC124286631 [Haliotis rubra]
MGGKRWGNFTYLEEVGLSFALIKTTVQNWKMEKYCREMVEGGRLIVLDTKPKYEAMQHYMNEDADEGTPFYIGLKRRGAKKIHHWSNGKPIDDNFWCSGPGKPHNSPCTVLKRHSARTGYCIGVKPCIGGRIICEKP